MAGMGSKEPKGIEGTGAVAVTGAIDITIRLLREVLAVLDAHLERVDLDIRRSPDPDTWGDFDRWEWVVGLGFVACQTYIHDVIKVRTTGGEKGNLLRLGPKHRSGEPAALVIYEAANHWKHLTETHEIHPATTRKRDPRRSRRIALLEAIVGGPIVGGSMDYYVCSNVLLELTAPRVPRFENLLPVLLEWRGALPSPGGIMGVG